MERTLAALPLLLLILGTAPAQTKPAPDHEELYRKVAALDSTLFDAYNRCDLEAFARPIAPDIELYHDHDGLSRSRETIVAAVKSNICGKVRRELVPGSLEVYPLGSYGALEIGVHRFHHPGHDSTEPVGEGKFVHVWRNDGGHWTLARVISYDHHALAR
jgi:ketosteroid isomerase-like protein